MTTKDVLTLALEALEAAEFVYKVGLLASPVAVKAVKTKRDAAITAIKQAQAQPFSPRELLIANEQYRHEQQQKRAQAQQFMGFDVVLDPTMAPNEMKLVQAESTQFNFEQAVRNELNEAMRPHAEAIDREVFKMDSGTNKERGWIDVDFGAVFVALIFVGAVFGITGYMLAAWAWPYIKQMILWSLT